MLFRAEEVNRNTVFIPARSDTRSVAEKLSSKVLPLFFIETVNARRLPSIVSGVSEEASAEITFLFSLHSICSDAYFTLGLKEIHAI